MSNLKKSIVTALFISLCAALPAVFHSMPNAGNVLCPMHIPVLLCGLICGYKFGLACGLAGPLASAVTTGMPSASYLPVMTSELAVYGLVTGLMMSVVRTKRIYADLYISLLSAMIAGRIVVGALRAFIFTPGAYSMALWTTSYFITGFPGIAVQIMLIPSIVFALTKSRLIPERYPAKFS